MPLISKRLLRSTPSSASAGYGYGTKSARAILEDQARTSKDQTFDIFLSHSYADAKSLDADDLVRIKTILEAHGLTVYVDWIVDSGLSRENVTVENAAIIRHRMNNSRALMYATSENASKSKWMPWELGYFDGKNGRAAILPINDDTTDKSTFHGQEYLGLYPFVTYSSPAGYPGGIALWIETKDGKFVSLTDWIKGKDPYKH